MKYKLSQAKYWVDDAEKDELEKLGFSFTKGKGVYESLGQWVISGDPEVEINTLEDLNDFVKTYGEIVLRENSITIYNDYLE